MANHKKLYLFAALLITIVSTTAAFAFNDDGNRYTRQVVGNDSDPFELPEPDSEEDIIGTTSGM